MSGRALVIDANILVRAVLGRRVREIIETYAEQATFFVPDVAYAEAEEHVPALVIRRGGDPEKAVRFLSSLRGLGELIGSEVYGDFESMARERLGERDPEDWPILASALAIGCPIWTEDTDFFGCGVPTWTTSRVVMFLRELKNGQECKGSEFGRSRADLVGSHPGSGSAEWRASSPDAQRSPRLHFVLPCRRRAGE